MNFSVTLIIGFLAAWSARSTFPGSRFLGVAGTLTLGTLGSMLGGLVSSYRHGPDQLVDFSPMQIWWSTLGAVMVLASAFVARRAQQPQTVKAPEAE